MSTFLLKFQRQEESPRSLYKIKTCDIYFLILYTYIYMSAGLYRMYLGPMSFFPCRGWTPLWAIWKRRSIMPSVLCHSSPVCMSSQMSQSWCLQVCSQSVEPLVARREVCGWLKNPFFLMHLRLIASDFWESDSDKKSLRDRWSHTQVGVPSQRGTWWLQQGKDV